MNDKAKVIIVVVCLAAAAGVVLWQMGIFGGGSSGGGGGGTVNLDSPEPSDADGETGAEGEAGGPIPVPEDFGGRRRR